MTEPRHPPGTNDAGRPEPTLHEPSRPENIPPDLGGERPVKGPAGGRTPYPAHAPPIDDLPGAEPDYEPGRPLDKPTPSL